LKSGENLARLGKASARLLRKDDVAIANDIELTFVAPDVFGRNTVRVQLGRETRGPLVIASSGRAVVDLDGHGSQRTSAARMCSHRGAGRATEGRYMAKARTTRMRAIVVLIAGLLVVAVVWAGTALGGGSGGGAKPSTPAQSDTGRSQSGKQTPHKNCPRDRAHDSSIDL
jgi:hypothetical protein